MNDIPHMNEIAFYCIQNQSPRDYDYSWIKGEVLSVYVCEDGFVLIVWNKEIK